MLVDKSREVSGLVTSFELFPIRKSLYKTHFGTCTCNTPIPVLFGECPIVVHVFSSTTSVVLMLQRPLGFTLIE